MQENEFKYYEKIGNWDFSQIKSKTEKLTNWDFYEKIKENTNEKSLCLDLGTGGGERVLKNYPDVGMIIATDYSEKMIKTAKENAIKKAIEYFKETKMSVIAEDSGLYIDKFSKEEQPRAICAKNKWKRRFR